MSEGAASGSSRSCSRGSSAASSGGAASAATTVAETANGIEPGVGEPPHTLLHHVEHELVATGLVRGLDAQRHVGLFARRDDGREALAAVVIGVQGAARGQPVVADVELADDGLAPGLRGHVPDLERHVDRAAGHQRVERLGETDLGSAGGGAQGLLGGVRREVLLAEVGGHLEDEEAPGTGDAEELGEVGPGEVGADVLQDDVAVDEVGDRVEVEEPQVVGVVLHVVDPAARPVEAPGQLDHGGRDVDLDDAVEAGRKGLREAGPLHSRSRRPAREGGRGRRRGPAP